MQKDVDLVFVELPTCFFIIFFLILIHIYIFIYIFFWCSGILRVPGSVDSIEQLKVRVEEGNHIHFEEWSCFDVTGLLKVCDFLGVCLWGGN